MISLGEIFQNTRTFYGICAAWRLNHLSRFLITKPVITAKFTPLRYEVERIDADSMPRFQKQISNKASGTGFARYSSSSDLNTENDITIDHKSALQRCIKHTPREHRYLTTHCKAFALNPLQKGDCNQNTRIMITVRETR